MTDNTNTATPPMARPELAIFDQAHRHGAELQDLDDGALARQVELAYQAVAVEGGRLDDLRQTIDAVRQAHGPGAIDQLTAQELAQAQKLRIAQLQLAQARADVDRRQREREAESHRQAEEARAQALATKRAEAWARYQADAGTDANGTPRADAQAFDKAWAAYLVNLSLGVVEL